MKKFDIYLLMADNPSETIEALTEDEAVDKFCDKNWHDLKVMSDAGCFWRVVAEEVDEDEEEEELDDIGLDLED